MFTPALARNLLMVLLGTCLGASSLRSAEDPNGSFVERVKPADYYAAERLFPEQFSTKNELSILRTSGGKPVSVIAIAREGEGDGYLLTLHYASATTPGGWIRITEELEASVGQQVLRAAELTLHYQVTLSKFKHLVSKTDSDLWLYQKLADGRSAAAVITTEDSLNEPRATLFIEGLLERLQQLAGKEGADRVELLQKIDRAATDLIVAASR